MATPLPLLPTGPNPTRRATLVRRVRLLVAATITYNVIEVCSAAAVAWQFTTADHERRERTALRIVAVSFFALAAYVTVESVRALLGGSTPPSDWCSPRCPWP